MPSINVNIATSAGTKQAIVHIDDLDVTSSAGNPYTISSGSHVLHYWIVGSPGSTIDITVAPAAGGIPLIDDLADKIQPGYVCEAGDQAFNA